MGVLKKTSGRAPDRPESRGRGRWRKAAAACVALVAAVATLGSGMSTASASTTMGPGYWFEPFQDGTDWVAYHGSALGVQGYNGGNPVYCIQAGTPADVTDGAWETTTDTNSVIGATMINLNRSDTSDFTQASVQYAIHDHLDRAGSSWAVYKTKPLEGGDINAVAANAATLWNRAAASVPSNAEVSYAYTQGQRKGTVAVGLTNSSNAYISGLTAAVTLDGPATFDSNGSKTMSVTTTGSLQHLAWTATGNGTVNSKVTFSVPRGAKLSVSSQDMFKAATDPETRTANIQFTVRKDFQPTVSTEVSHKELTRGQTVQDKVTSGVKSGDEWVTSPTVSVKAKGYYFTGDKSILTAFNQSGTTASPEDPSAYLKRVEAKYGDPVATATTTFTNSGQTNTVTAKAADGTDYVNQENGKFGTWVWIIVKSDQSSDLQDYITNNYIDSFGQVKESDVHQRQASIWSEVAEPHAQKGSDVRDVIHVKGLPKDLGSFGGDSTYGFTADNTKATVEVWWSGASGGNAGVEEEDLKYQPSTSETPTEDANHKLLKTVTYDLASLIKAEGANYDGSLDIKVAGGKDGDPLADGSHFTVTADNTGYYTFVFKYTGSSRVKAYTSDYDDQFESTFVTTPKTTVALSSNANPDSVRVGEEFWDTATISGDNSVTEGAYVTFDAYNPVAGSPDPSVGKLLDGDKQVLTDDQLSKLHAGYQIDVASTHIKAQTSGTVYWQAALHAANGTILATHALGVKSESTVVKGGGTISSVAQTQGAVGGKAWDIITVGDRTNGSDRGNIPEGSKVVVNLYKHEGQNQATKGQLVASKTFTVDTSKLGTRPGSYSFKAEVGTYPAAGQYNWVAKLVAPDGSILDTGSYGEDTERTAVQDYSTDAAKKWLSNNDSDYSDSTIKTYDVLTQKSYEHWGTDMESDAVEGQTMPGTQATFSINREGTTQADDTTVLTGDAVDLPRVPDASKNPEQKVKSQTFALPASAEAGTYYYGLRVTNSVDAANLKKLVGETSDGLVYEAPKRVKSESFDVVKVASKSSDTLWTSTQKHVEDTLLVTGNLPAGSSYEVQVWSTDASGKAVKQVSTTGRKTIEKAITGSGEIKVSLDNPGTGTYQFRHKVWTPDNQGGDPDVADGSEVVSDDWKASPDKTAGYSDGALLYEGVSVASERFSVIEIDTDVTGTTNMHTASNGEHYVDTTNGADVNDHATITGDIPAGYKLGFELYKQDSGKDSAKDVLIETIKPTDVAEATKELDSATVSLNDYGDFYWVTVFEKADGSAWSPDGETQVRSERRVKSETFHAARVTTTTYRWTSKDGKATDTALIEGCVPSDSTITFDLHEYESQKQVGTTSSTLSDLGYKDCANGDDTQSVTSGEVDVPDATDYYWVESVRLPGEDVDFHRGDDRVPNESTRAIDATTSVSTEFSKGTAVSDHTVFANIKYSEDIPSGTTEDGSKSDDTQGDIRDDLTASLRASWELWKQDSGDDAAKDKLVTTVDKDGVALEEGQETADSSKYTPGETGLYYWRVRITDPDGTLVKYGAARDKTETFRIVEASSKTTRVVSNGTAITDSVTIEGPVAQNTLVSWKAYRQKDGSADKDEQVLDYATPETGAVLISAKQAATALSEGSVTVETPKPYKDAKTGDTIYWVFSLTSPTKNDDGTFAAPTTDAEPFFTELARNESETVSVIDVTTKTNGTATVGDTIHDTALIDGTIPSGYCVEFEYWKQNDGDVSKDKLVETTKCVTVKAGATSVDSPGIVAKTAGTYYFRERLVPVTPTTPTDVVHYGKPRVPGETVNVKAKPLAQTGVGVVGAALVAGGSVFLGLGLLTGRRRRGGFLPSRARHSAV